MKSKAEAFGRIGYCGILGSDKKFNWSTQPALFRKLSASRSFTDVAEKASLRRRSFECRFTYEGIRFKTVFLPIPSECYICMAYPEDNFVKYAYSEMYMRIYNIKRNSNKSVAGLTSVLELLEKQGLPDETLGLIQNQIRISENIFRESRSITDLFDLAHMSEYVMINEKIERSYKRVLQTNAAVGKNITFDMRIEQKVARINYMVFETILFETVRIIYKFLPSDGSAVLRIRGSSDKQYIMLSCVSCINEDFDCSSIDGEIRDINCAVECLGGFSKICYNDGKLIIKTNILSPLSDYVKRVKENSLFGERDNELRGYGRTFSSEPDPDHGLVLHAPRYEHLISFSMLISNIMFSEVTPEYIEDF